MEWFWHTGFQIEILQILIQEPDQPDTIVNFFDSEWGSDESGLLNSSRRAANSGKRLHMRALVVHLRPIKIISRRDLEERLVQTIGVEIAC